MDKIMKKAVLTLLILCNSLVMLIAQGERLTPEKLWEIGRVSLEDVSPNGLLVLYGVTYYDVAQNKGNKDLYIVPVEGGDARKITAFEGSESNGRFRPDGKKIGFLYEGNLWEMNLNGTDMEKVSEEPMNGFSYAPTMDKILFIREVDYSEQHPLMEGLDKADARIIEDLMYRHWDIWEDDKHSNVFYVAYDDGKLTGEPVNIIHAPYDSPLKPFGGMEQITWSPDGEGIVYTCKKMSGLDYAESTNSDLYLYYIEDGVTVNLTKQNEGYDMEPVFSPNGEWLAWNSMETPGFEADRNRIMLLNVATGERKELTEGLDYSANHPRWSADGKTIYYTAGIEATYQAFAADLGEMRHRQITNGVHNIYDLEPAGDFLIGRVASMSMPHEIYKINKGNGEMTNLSRENEEFLSDIQMGKVEAKWVETIDGREMKVWWIYPPEYDSTKIYPALLYCQGGPQSAVSQFFSFRWNFQLMAADDYIIIAPNRRGLPSFGREWNDQISGDWGGLAMQDYLSAIDDAVKSPNIDKDRVGAIGASFGGYSVYWLAGNHEGRFSSFISHCGLFNLESWYGTTEELFFANKDIEGPYWQEPTPLSYMTDSPHKYVHNWDTPMLVIHGEKDFRVPVSEGMQAFQAAQVKGIKSKFLYFPDEGHWVLSPQNGILWHRVFFDWLNETVKKKQQEP
jgi:dipeptidyl aminopeptidase/acylaminoacyl peptidase